MNTPYRQQVQKGKSEQKNWDALWTKLRLIYRVAGMDRHRAVIDNFRDQKERICRAMGVVSEADLSRISNRISDRARGT